MSKKAMKGAHAEHIHANCDCTYAVRFGGKGGVDGYDPDKYLEIYDDAEGDTWQEKLNSMRRKSYAENGEKIREQKRAAYEIRKDLLYNKGIESTMSKKVDLNKIASSGKVENPMPKEEYYRIKSRLEDNGIEVFAATSGDDLRYMLAIGAEGTYSDGRITHIGEIPSKGTLLEEIIHATQARKYGELAETDFNELFAREIEANRKLLKNAKSYGLDECDISDIKRNLESWEKSFEKSTGERYNENSIRGNI